MSRMTVIQLLNKIANGEEVPKKIKINGYIYEYQGDDYLYIDKNNDNHEYWLFSEGYTDKFQWIENFLRAEIETIEENELHANSVEFNINNDKRDCIITLDENDLGIDKLHLDNCYFYKENDKWYVRKYDFKTIELEEKKIPEKLGKIEDNDGYIDQYDVIKIGKKVDEIIDYLKSKGE